jgi:hypothetical protein
VVLGGLAVSLLRVEDRSGLTAAVDAIQRRAIIPFANATERGQQLTAPDKGTVTVLVDTLAFEYWSGSAWTPLAGSTAALEARVTTLESQMSSVLSRLSSVESVNTTQNNRLDALEANAPPKIRAGYSVVNTDGNALCTISHNLGVTPSAFLAMLQNQSILGGGSVNDWVLFNTGASATAIVLRLGDSHGDQYVNRTGIGVYWVAIA